MFDLQAGTLWRCHSVLPIDDDVSASVGLLTPRPDVENERCRPHLGIGTPGQP
jgi:hypothetical protein